VTAGPPARNSVLPALLSQEVQRRTRRAFLIALGLGLVAVFALGASFLPITLSADLLISYGVFLAVYALALALVLLRDFGHELGDALAVVIWGRLDAEEHSKRLTGAKIPVGQAAAAAWLARHGETPGLAPQRVVAQILNGDLEGARTTLRDYPTTTPYERFELASDRWFVDFVSGVDAPTTAVDAAAEEVVDPEDRARAAASVATLRAHALAAGGGNWLQALASARAAVGHRANMLVVSRMLVPAWTFYMASAALLIGIALLVGRATGVWR
jgi:hypothetical protein